MLQALRDNLKGTVAIIIVGLMIIPFALFGVESLFMQDSASGNVAEVNGEPISEAKLQRQLQMQRQQMQERFGDQVPTEMLSDESLRGPVLTQLQQRELLRQAALDGGMAVSEKTLDSFIVETPQFQVDGKFSPELYTQLLRNAGFSPVTYKQQMAEDILVSQHATAITDTGFALKADLERLSALSRQTRSFDYIVLPAEKVREGIELSDDEIQSYYDDHGQDFMNPEQVSVEYLEINLDDLATTIDVDIDEIRAQYEQEVKNFPSGIERHAAHILVEDGEGADQKIAEIEKALADGEDFAEVAKTQSDDFGSRDLGGDLGYTDGTAFPQPFEEALANLQPGEVSAPVKTDAGTHFIKLVDTKEMEPPTFAEEEETIRERLQLAEAESRYVELLDELPDATYSVASLTEAADELGLEVHESDLFGRQGGDGVLAEPKVVSAAFSRQVLDEDLASDLIELSDRHVVVVKKKEYRPAEPKSLEDSREEITDLLTAERTREQLDSEIIEIKKAVTDRASLDEVAEARGLEVKSADKALRDDAELPPGLLAEVFAAPRPGGAPVAVSAELMGGDFGFALLTDVQKGETPELDKEQLHGILERLGSQNGDAELAVYQNSLSEAAEIKVY